MAEMLRQIGLQGPELELRRAIGFGRSHRVVFKVKGTSCRADALRARLLLVTLKDHWL